MSDNDDDECPPRQRRLCNIMCSRWWWVWWLFVCLFVCYVNSLTFYVILIVSVITGNIEFFKRKRRNNCLFILKCVSMWKLLYLNDFTVNTRNQLCVFFLLLECAVFNSNVVSTTIFYQLAIFAAVRSVTNW